MNFAKREISKLIKIKIISKNFFFLHFCPFDLMCNTWCTQLRASCYDLSNHICCHNCCSYNRSAIDAFQPQHPLSVIVSNESSIYTHEEVNRREQQSESLIPLIYKCTLYTRLRSISAKLSRFFSIVKVCPKCCLSVCSFKEMFGTNKLNKLHRIPIEWQMTYPVYIFR